MPCCPPCSWCCFFVWLGTPFLVPLWTYGSQCHDGQNTLQVQVTNVSLRTKAQDKDGEDDIRVHVDSGMCGSSGEKFHLKEFQTANHQHRRLEGDTVTKDEHGEALKMPRTFVWYSAPVTVYLEEADFFANDHGMQVITIPPQNLSRIQKLLESDKDIPGIEITGFITVAEQNPLKFLHDTLEKFGLEDVLCVSAIDVALTVAAPMVPGAGAGGSFLRLITKGWARVQDAQDAYDTANAVGYSNEHIDKLNGGITAFQDSVTVCPAKLAEAHFMGDTAIYSVTVRVSLAPNRNGWMKAGFLTGGIVVLVPLICVGLFTLFTNGPPKLRSASVAADSAESEESEEPYD